MRISSKPIVACVAAIAVAAAGMAATGCSRSQEKAAVAAPASGPLGAVPAGVKLSPEGKYPAETVKFGFVNYDSTAQQVLELKSYYEYLQQAYNFEILWSESIGSAEAEMAFIEQCASAGCKGIIGYYTEGRAEAVKLAASLGMYYWGGAETAPLYEPMKNDKMYVGGYDTGNTNYDFGFAIAQALANAGCHNVIVMSGGKDYGVPFFVDRYNGIMDGLKAARDAGSDIKMVYEVPGWPGTEEFAAHQAAALDTNADGLAGTLTALMWIQPLQNSGKFGKIKIASIESVNDDMVGLMQAGAYVGMCSEITSSMGLSVPMLLNAVEGFGDKQRNADGTAAKVAAKNWIITSLDQLKYYASIEKKGGTWAYDIGDVKSILGAFNPSLDVAKMDALYSAVSVGEIEARHK